MSSKYILRFDEISKKDLAQVGGKNSSLGEMFNTFAVMESEKINIPDGFATTSEAYWHFLSSSNLLPQLKVIFENLNTKDIYSLQKAGKSARELILQAAFPKDFEDEIRTAYYNLVAKYGKDSDVAVRSSATAEDLPSASFAGQHESYLNVNGENEVLQAVKNCIASLFNDRAISYREEKGFEHFKIALSVGVQKMVRSDVSCSGVMFTLDTESGFRDVVLVEGSWGLGEMIVKGKVVPDAFMVFKPTLTAGFESLISKQMGSKKRKMIYGSGSSSVKEMAVSKKDQSRFILSDKEVLTLARWAVVIEDHYKMPMDIEWAKDGKTDELFILQARPETIHAPKKITEYTQYKLLESGQFILQGEAIGSQIVTGMVRVIADVKQIGEFQPNEILVTKITDPDWEPIMKIAKAIITEEGSRVSHAAIVSRELGVSALVGAAKAMKMLKTGQIVTVDCSTGQKGRVYEGEVKYEIKKFDLKNIPETKTKIMINTSHPDVAFQNSFLPNSGVGLAREEFIIASQIQIHPMALIKLDEIKDKSAKRKIEKLTQGYDDKREYFIDKLSQGVGKIAAAFYPKPVIVRLSDFKSNEYSTLLGGKEFEPAEENPMIGFRGASRYYSDSFKPAFLMECEALKRVREKFGLKNIKIMVPFCRTLAEGKQVLDLMKDAGLRRGEDGLEVYVMAELPSNVILADYFLSIFDGMSIGSNDLTQLVLGLDRDSALIASIGDERNEAVKEMIKKIIESCRKRKKYVGICGEAPSYFPEFAEFLVQEGIHSISLNPDTVIKTTMIVAAKEQAIGPRLK